MGVDVDAIKGDGIFSFEHSNGLQAVIGSQKLRVWRLYYSLAKVYLELEALRVLVDGAFLLAPPRVSLSGYVGRGGIWWSEASGDESPIVPKRLVAQE